MGGEERLDVFLTIDEEFRLEIGACGKQRLQGDLDFRFVRDRVGVLAVLVRPHPGKEGELDVDLRDLLVEGEVSF